MIRNISSSSKIQREPEKPLQPATIQTLVDAQKAAQQTGFVTARTVCSERVVQYSDKRIDGVGAQYEEVHRAPIPSNPALSKDWTQSFVSENEPPVLIRGLPQPISSVTGGIETGYINVAGTPAMHPFQPVNMMAHHQIPQPAVIPKALGFE